MALLRIKKYQCDVLITLNTELDSLKRIDEDAIMSEAPVLVNGIDPQL